MIKICSIRWVAACFAATLLSAYAFGGEPALVDLKFDDLDLKALPPGWEKSEPSDSQFMTMIVEEGRGKVLKLSNKAGNAMNVTVTLDAAKVIGKTLTVSTWSKFPGKYTPIAEKPWARPKLYINAKDARGKSIHSISLTPQPEKPEWQELKDTIAVPASAVGVVAQFIVAEVECEAFFDGLVIVVSDAPAVAAAPANPANPAAPANPVNPAKPDPAKPAAPVAPVAPVAPAKPVPPPVDPNSPAALAAKAPRKTFEDGGMTFGPEIATALQKNYPSKTVTAGTVLLVGPGIADKSALPKFSTPWRPLPLSAKLTGAAATPRNLLLALPEVLLKDKPEVVFVSSDPAPGRKATSSESEDWDDVGRLCKRFGALPVFIPHTNEAKDEQFDHIVQGFRKASEISSYIMISSTPAEAFPKRMDNLLKLLDIHVFARVKTEAEPGKSATPGGKPLEE